MNNYDNKAYFVVMKLNGAGVDGAAISIKVPGPMAVVEDRYKGEFWLWAYNKRRKVADVRYVNFGFNHYNPASPPGYLIMTQPYNMADIKPPNYVDASGTSITPNYIECIKTPPITGEKENYTVSIRVTEYI